MLCANSGKIPDMNAIKIFKALANDSRLQVLYWLKDPKAHFTNKNCDLNKPLHDMDDVGVCVGLIQQKLGLSQSTVSQYLSILQDAGLIKATRIGQWTYYQRNEKAITAFTKALQQDL